MAVRNSQTPLEIIIQSADAKVRTSQIALEIITEINIAKVRLSNLMIEIIVPNDQTAPQIQPIVMVI